MDVVEYYNSNVYINDADFENEEEKDSYYSCDFFDYGDSLKDNVNNLEFYFKIDKESEELIFNYGINASRYLLYVSDFEKLFKKKYKKFLEFVYFGKNKELEKKETDYIDVDGWTAYGTDKPDLIIKKHIMTDLGGAGYGFHEFNF